MSASNEPTFQAPPPPTPTAAPRAPRPTKLRPVAIGIFVLGLLVLGGGIARVIPGGVGTGAALCFLGLLLFALSFIPLPVVPDTEAPLPVVQKLTGIFYEPSRVFRNLRVHPHWAAAFILIVVLTAIYSFAFIQRITPERIVDHSMEKMAELGAWAPPPQAMEQIKADQLSALKNPVERIGGVVKSVVFAFVLSAFVSALALGGMLAFGGRINFWQSLAVNLYAAVPVAVIQKLLGLVILYLKAPEDLHPILNQETTLQDNLGILFSPASNPILYVIGSLIGLTALYGVWLRARGLHLGATKASSTAGWAASIMLYLLLMFFVIVLTALFPGFIQ